MDYDKMLKECKDNLPEIDARRDRFEIPKVKGHIQGNRTVINNFYQIASTISRRPEHLLKFVLKELATPGELKKNALIIGTKIPAARINEKIQQYSTIYVICRECGKPDTELLREDGVVSIKCTACGAKHPIPQAI